MRDLQQTGTCINCGREGPVGEYCTNEECRKQDYAFIPVKIERDDIYLGKRIDDFLLIGVVGKGGFGKVYRALQMPVGLEVALKFLTAEADEAMTERFFREAQSLAMLKHPNVVRLNKFGNYRGKPYIAMELVDNARSLDKEIRDRVRQHKVFSRAEAKHILQQILNALGEAHSLDIVHRDIKPENILLQRVRGDDLFVRVLDFGLAKFTNQGAGMSMMMGTPKYMAPEQFSKGEEIGPWTDLYALTVLTFELITGRSLFKGSTHQVVGQKLLSVEELFRQRSDLELDPKAMEFFKKGLARDQKQRFQNTDEFGEALEGLLDYLDGHSSATMSPSDLEDLLDTTDWHKVREGTANFAAHNEKTTQVPEKTVDDARSQQSATPQKASGSKGKIIAGVVVLLLIALGGAAFVFLRPAGHPDKKPTTLATTTQPPKNTKKTPEKKAVASAEPKTSKPKKQKSETTKPKTTVKTVQNRMETNAKPASHKTEKPQTKPSKPKKASKTSVTAGKKVKKPVKKQTKNTHKDNKTKEKKSAQNKKRIVSSNPVDREITAALKLSGLARIRALKACLKKHGSKCCKADKYLGMIYLGKHGDPETALPYWKAYKACASTSKEKNYADSMIQRIVRYLKEQ